MLKYPNKAVNVSKSTKSFIQLTWTEYIVFVFICQVGNLQFVARYLTSNLHYGGIIYTLLFICFYLFMGMPLTALYLFLGHFSKCGFFRLWSISPLFKGVSCTAVILGLLQTVMNSVVTAMCFVYIIDIIKFPIEYWSNCNFPKASNTCIKYSSDVNFTMEDRCCWTFFKRDCTGKNGSYDPNYNLASLDFFRNEISRMYPPNNSPRGLGQADLHLSLSVTLLWIITAIMASMTFSLIKNTIKITGTIAFLCLTFCFWETLLFGVTKTNDIVFHNDFKYLTLPSTYTTTFLNVCSMLLPLQLVYIGSLAPENTIPSVDSVLVAIIVLTTFVCFSISMTIGVEMIGTVTGIKNLDCITYLGVEVLLALVPDYILNYLPMVFVSMLIYYTGLFLFGLCFQIICITCILDSLEEVHQKISNYRIPVCVALCIICCLISIVFVTPAFIIISENWQHYVDDLIIILVIVLFAIATCWIYGVGRINDDIEFKYKIKVSLDFWLTCWKLLPFITLVIFIQVIVNKKAQYDLIPEMLSLKVTFAVLTALFLLPIPLYAVYYYFVNVKLLHSKNILNLMKCDADWGPPDQEFRRLRNHFNSKKEIRYKSERRHCYHHCLLNSTKLQKEIERLETNRRSYMEELKRRTAEKEPEAAFPSN